MDVRQSILAAADTIERNPQSWNFFIAHIPTSLRSDGCAIGWIGHFLQPELRGRPIQYLYDRIGLRTDAQFYTRIEEIHHRMTREFRSITTMRADQIAKYLRIYADEYYPANRPKMPPAVRALFDVKPHAVAALV